MTLFLVIALPPLNKHTLIPRWYFSSCLISVFMWCCCSVSKVLSWQQGNNDFQPSRCFRSLCKKAKICVWPMSNEGFKRRRHDLWNRFCHSLLKKTTYTVQMFQSRTCSAAWIRCVRNGLKQTKTESFKCKYHLSWIITTKKSTLYRSESKKNIFVPSCSFEILS